MVIIDDPFRHFSGCQRAARHSQVSRVQTGQALVVGQHRPHAFFIDPSGRAVADTQAKEQDIGIQVFQNQNAGAGLAGAY
ncbi:hypothetical protein RM543_12855 [Roseicyclus sp. F158]|uniref:Uncharacterized protein n=1 Tax=Tropicimonas omnivorans TaxID=3075590 RepID=A0ABU3DJ71_9RHOB|nr:hypothetical protein [Roseicyclus sp. F158]MDT0683579.1 hypothetical protein [Roseicyclus sp. F158]